MQEPTGRAKGGVAAAAKLTKEARVDRAKKAVSARMEKAKLPKATHGSNDTPLRIGDITIPCYVLEDGRRVLTMRGLQTSLGFSSGGGKEGARKIPSFLSKLEKNGLQINDLAVRADSPFDFIVPQTNQIASAYEATILVDICEAVLQARDQGLIATDSIYAKQCETLVRGFARVGIVSLVDEVTGFQKDRTKDALAQILEKFIAKELQPYVRTFPSEFYEQLFRLRGLKYPPDTPKFRPQYFGTLTNDIVYERLAPGLLDEIKKQASKDAKKAHLHRRLTQEVGHPKLREHLSAVIMAMKMSPDYPAFISNLNRFMPRFGQSYTLDLETQDR
jgi:hypothetical protein